MSAMYQRTRLLGEASYRAIGVPSWGQIHELTKAQPHSAVTWLHTFRMLVALREAYDQLKARFNVTTSDIDPEGAWDGETPAFEDTSVDALKQGDRLRP